MPPTNPSLAVDSRATVRSVAARAAVSAMTVSRALRNHPSVSTSLRSRVLAAARELSYRPDPEVAKLMHHLRLRRKPAFQGSLCALTSIPPRAPYRDYSHAIVAGARRQAEARGYSFTTQVIGDSAAAGRSLQRILCNRGVEGVLLLPMAVPAQLAGLLEWERFSVVATTSSVLTPEVHRVLPHHFRNTQLLCRELRARGYRRIGVVLTEEHTERVQHAVNSAVVWHEVFEHGACVPPLIYRGPQPLDLRTWFAREQPDVIVTHTERLCRAFAQTLGLKIPGPVGFVSTYTTADSAFAGIDERPEHIGVQAADLLTDMIRRGEKGVPEVANATLLQGRWLANRSCPVRRRHAMPPASPSGDRWVHWDASLRES